MTIKKMFRINEPAQNFNVAPKIIEKANEIFIIFDYEDDEGKYRLTGLTFENGVKYRRIKEDSLEKYMLESYNAVSVVDDSPWIEKEGLAKEKDLKHFLIYFDGFGAYEFIARDVTYEVKNKELLVY